jgi:hypothetical protein
VRGVGVGHIKGREAEGEWREIGGGSGEREREDRERERGRGGEGERERERERGESARKCKERR